MDNNRILFKANNGSYNEFENSNLELIALERKRKEILVGKIHKNKITKPVGTCKSFRTYVNGKRISGATYDDIIDRLYDIYYGKKVVVTSVKNQALPGFFVTYVLFE